MKSIYVEKDVYEQLAALAKERKLTVGAMFTELVRKEAERDERRHL